MAAGKGGLTRAVWGELTVGGAGWINWGGVD